MTFILDSCYPCNMSHIIQIVYHAIYVIYYGIYVINHMSCGASYDMSWHMCLEFVRNLILRFMNTISGILYIQWWCSENADTVFSILNRYQTAYHDTCILSLREIPYCESGIQFQGHLIICCETLKTKYRFGCIKPWPLSNDRPRHICF